ncbi:hypothetical protein AAFC00_003026 [Neodothiora populina]|uniref:BTB domain-containing protein n=1 Tax=Neodothiora populina TaxID=2781224 RepID=A0ABR3P9F1_9PEZI
MQSTPLKKSKAQTIKSATAKDTKQTPQPPDPPVEVDPALVSANGDLVLAVKRQLENQADDVFLYRVESKRLREASPYFARLLDPDKFGEGAQVKESHSVLRTRYPSPAAVPLEELPQVDVADVGRISSNVKSIRNLMGDFLRALHDAHLAVKIPPLANVANMLVVADRFDALAAVRQYFERRKLIAALDATRGQNSKSGTKPEPEERVRQRLLVGLFLDNPSWVWSSSLRLIHKGWLGRETDVTSALWWDLPQGIEEELLFRRDCILESIQSLQTHFLHLYTCRDRQCKLGYDSSAECDLYQLGQMVKFFRKINTLNLQGRLISTTPEGEPCETEQDFYYDADLFDLLDEFRKAPEYQIDKNHRHCGLRTRLLPLIDLVSLSLSSEVGLCLNCWQESRNEYAWSRVKRPLIWTHGSAGAGMASRYRDGQTQRHLFRHLDARDLFVAKERVWTTSDEGRVGIGWSHPNLPYK